MTEPTEEGPGYWAYFSYSHDDEREAVGLHRRLERFRIPPPLQGRRIGDRIAGKNLQPIFRDRDELSSASSLSDSLDEALRRSHALIVLCSPAAAKSKWVNLEIERFVEMHGSQRIFPLILDGKPGSGDATECFPPALRQDGVEPIAADLQPSGDGANDAVLKVVSGILEIPFDRLKQREAQRRQRRLIGITAMTTAIALVTSLLALYAFHQRAQAIEQRQLAEQRRSQAEDLITFMLGDLRERLESLGRLDVLEAVGDKATAYFESLPPSELTDRTLASQANALRQIGQIRIQQGRFREAQVAFRIALEQIRELQRRNSDKPDFLFDRSQAEYWVAYSHYLSRDYAEAERYFTQYRDSTATLVELDPTNTDYRIELAYAYSNLGTVAHNLHDVTEALAAFRQCRTIFDELYVENPEDLNILFEIAATDSWLGRTYKSRYELKEALDNYERSASTHAEVSGRSGHFFHRQMEAESLSNLSAVRFDSGDTSGALEDERRAAGIYRELVEHDEENLDWQLRSLMHESQVLWIDFLVNPVAERRQAMLNILRDAEEIAAGDPSNGDWTRIVLQIALDTLYAATYAGDLTLMDELLGRYRHTEEVLEDPGSADHSAIQDLLRFRIASSIRRHLSGDHDDAVEQAGDALALFDKHPEILAQHLPAAAILHRITGAPAEAEQLERQLESRGFASQAHLTTLAILGGLDVN